MTHSSLTNQIRLSPQNSSRQGAKIDTFLIHHTASVSGRGDGIVSMMVNRTRVVSSNYVLGSDGYLWMVVDEDLRAWTSGATNDGGRGAAWDRRSITIEICNSSGAPNWDISEASITKAAQLLRDLRRRYGIRNVLGHRDLYTQHGASYPTFCPGPNTVARILAREQELIRAEQPKPPAIDPNVKVEVGSLVGVKNSVKAHRNAADALAARNATATYAPGNYYVFKIAGAAVNLSKTKGKAGGWVSIAAAGLQAPAPAPEPPKPPVTPPAPPKPVEPPKPPVTPPAPVEPPVTPPAPPVPPVEPPKPPVDPTPTPEPKPEPDKPVEPAPVEPTPPSAPEPEPKPEPEPEKPVEPTPPASPSKPTLPPIVAIIVLVVGAVVAYFADKL